MDGHDWLRTTVIYELDVRRFADSDGDGVGDLRGVIENLDYLADLGVGCIWLLPFFPSPMRDNGYDVSDYFAVDERLGTLDDFEELVARARERGMRVVIDAILNHTSDRHPWFLAARRSSSSVFRGYYLFSPGQPPDEGLKPAFPGEEDEVWTWDERAQAFYYHKYYRSEPELDLSNPVVCQEIHKVLDFWLALGVAGFRLDATAPLIRLGVGGETEPYYEHEILKRIRSFVEERRPDAALLGEVNVELGDLAGYFGDGDELHSIFNFVLNARLFEALARERAAAVVEAMRETPPPDPPGQWLTFLRNHDELNLVRLPRPALDEVMARLAPDESMRLYGHGVRRRLAPMMGGDERRVALAFALLLSLPGTPVLLWGEEIGMGEDLSQRGRAAVRSPMQWSSARNAGFSTAAADALIQPVIDEGPFAFTRVNVDAQSGRQGSLLERVRELLRVRRDHPELAIGEWTPLDSGHDAVLAALSRDDRRAVVTVHNLAARPVELTLLVDGRLDPIVGGGGPVGRGERLALPGHGFRWFHLVA